MLLCTVQKKHKEPPPIFSTDFVYLLTPWSRVLLEKLTGLQLVKKFLAFHGTRRFITALTSVRHLSLSWASPIQSMYAHPTSWRSSLILSTQLRTLHMPVLNSSLFSNTQYAALYKHRYICSRMVECCHTDPLNSHKQKKVTLSEATSVKCWLQR